MPTETLAQVCARLDKDGYTGQCRAEEDGIRFLGDADAVFAPESLHVDASIRLEGTSAPSEQTVIFALRSPDGSMKATYTVTHGPDIDPIDVDMLQRLVVEPDSDRPKADAAGPLRPQY